MSCNIGVNHENIHVTHCVGNILLGRVAAYIVATRVVCNLADHVVDRVTERVADRVRVRLWLIVWMTVWLMPMWS